MCETHRTHFPDEYVQIDSDNIFLILVSRIIATWWFLLKQIIWALLRPVASWTVRNIGNSCYTLPCITFTFQYICETTTWNISLLALCTVLVKLPLKLSYLLRVFFLDRAIWFLKYHSSSYSWLCGCCCYWVQKMFRLQLILGIFRHQRVYILLSIILAGQCQKLALIQQVKNLDGGMLLSGNFRLPVLDLMCDRM